MNSGDVESDKNNNEYEDGFLFNPDECLYCDECGSKLYRDECPFCGGIGFF